MTVEELKAIKERAENAESCVRRIWGNPETNFPTAKGLRPLWESFQDIPALLAEIDGMMSAFVRKCGELVDCQRKQYSLTDGNAAGIPGLQCLEALGWKRTPNEVQASSRRLVLEEKKRENGLTRAEWVELQGLRTDRHPSTIPPEADCDDVSPSKEIQVFKVLKGQIVCPQCNGFGRSTPDIIHACPMCNGERVVKDPDKPNGPKDSEVFDTPMKGFQGQFPPEGWRDKYVNLEGQKTNLYGHLVGKSNAHKEAEFLEDPDSDGLGPEFPRRRCERCLSVLNHPTEACWKCFDQEGQPIGKDSCPVID